ncbi:MAG: helix-turn-helix transcriptional regulator, partial [Clostridia bacterium]|nr:helix-turn-helix transcriptional regulator [Clostridia bacterium]
QAFFSSKKNLGNKINSEIVRSSGLYDAIMRLKKYSDSFTTQAPITDCALTEILYILNNISDFSIADMSNNQLKEIIAYINRHFTEDISLDDISEKFFISKYYLCRQFKKFTGHTLQGYIRHKRLALVQELYNSGKSLSDSAVLAGFSDYSSFYRTYLNEYGVSPKKGL